MMRAVALARLDLACRTALAANARMLACALTIGSRGSSALRIGKGKNVAHENVHPARFCRAG
jgi:hypothetical protein